MVFPLNYNITQINWLILSRSTLNSGTTSMSEEKLQSFIGIFLVLSHFIVLFLVLIFTIFDRFTKPEMFTAVGLILPLFAAYTTAIVRQLMSLSRENIQASESLP